MDILAELIRSVLSSVGNEGRTDRTSNRTLLASHPVRSTAKTVRPRPLRLSSSNQSTHPRRLSSSPYTRKSEGPVKRSTLSYPQHALQSSRRSLTPHRSRAVTPQRVTRSKPIISSGKHLISRQSVKMTESARKWNKNVVQLLESGEQDPLQTDQSTCFPKTFSTDHVKKYPSGCTYHSKRTLEDDTRQNGRPKRRCMTKGAQRKIDRPSLDRELACDHKIMDLVRSVQLNAQLPPPTNLPRGGEQTRVQAREARGLADPSVSTYPISGGEIRKVWQSDNAQFIRDFYSQAKLHPDKRTICDDLANYSQEYRKERWGHRVGDLVGVALPVSVPVSMTGCPAASTGALTAHGEAVSIGPGEMDIRAPWVDTFLSMTTSPHQVNSRAPPSSCISPPPSQPNLHYTIPQRVATELDGKPLVSRCNSRTGFDGSDDYSSVVDNLLETSMEVDQSSLTFLPPLSRRPTFLSSELQSEGVNLDSEEIGTPCRTQQRGVSLGQAPTRNSLDPAQHLHYSRLELKRNISSAKSAYPGKRSRHKDVPSPTLSSHIVASRQPVRPFRPGYQGLPKSFRSLPAWRAHFQALKNAHNPDEHVTDALEELDPMAHRYSNSVLKGNVTSALWLEMAYHQVGLWVPTIAEENIQCHNQGTNSEGGFLHPLELYHNLSLRLDNDRKGEDIGRYVGGCWVLSNGDFPLISKEWQSPTIGHDLDALSRRRRRLKSLGMLIRKEIRASSEAESSADTGQEVILRGEYARSRSISAIRQLAKLGHSSPEDLSWSEEAHISSIFRFKATKQTRDQRKRGKGTLRIEEIRLSREDEGHQAFAVDDNGSEDIVNIPILALDTDTGEGTEAGLIQENRWSRSEIKDDYILFETSDKNCKPKHAAGRLPPPMSHDGISDSFISTLSLARSDQSGSQCAPLPRSGIRSRFSGNDPRSSTTNSRVPTIPPPQPVKTRFLRDDRAPSPPSPFHALPSPLRQGFNADGSPTSTRFQKKHLPRKDDDDLCGDTKPYAVYWSLSGLRASNDSVRKTCPPFDPPHDASSISGLSSSTSYKQPHVRTLANPRNSAISVFFDSKPISSLASPKSSVSLDLFAAAPDPPSPARYVDIAASYYAHSPNTASIRQLCWPVKPDQATPVSPVPITPTDATIGGDTLADRSFWNVPLPNNSLQEFNGLFPWQDGYTSSPTESDQLPGGRRTEFAKRVRNVAEERKERFRGRVNSAVGDGDLRKSRMTHSWGEDPSAGIEGQDDPADPWEASFADR